MTSGQRRGGSFYAGVLCKENICKKVTSGQRRGGLRIASSNRTVSETAVPVIGGIISIDLLAKERKHAYLDKAEGGTTTRRGMRQRTTQLRQKRWGAEAKGQLHRLRISQFGWAEWADCLCMMEKLNSTS